MLPSDHVLEEIDALAQLSFQVQNRIEARARDHRLSLIAVRLLGVLRDRRPTMSELTRLLDLDKSSITGLVDRAERRGLFRRTRSDEDGRSLLVSLTEEGAHVAGDVAAGFSADMDSLLGNLSAGDRQHLTRIISGLLVTDAAQRGIDLLSADHSGASPPPLHTRASRRPDPVENSPRPSAKRPPTRAESSSMQSLG